MNDKPWLVNVKGDAMIDMSNHEYLDHLLEKSRNIISPGNHRETRFLIWDLESIKDEQPDFYKKFSYIIENEIRNLNRLTKLEPYPRNRTRETEESSSNMIE